MKCANLECTKTKIFSGGYCSGCYSRLRRRGTLARKNVSNDGVCAEPGCVAHAHAKGLCSKHYQQALHPLRALWYSLRNRCTGDYPPEWDRFDAFLAAVGDRPSPRHQLRRIVVERPWSAANAVWREPILVDTTTAEGRAKYQWLWHIRKRYGLTEADILAMAEEQDNRCAICRDPLGMPHPDTGKPIKVCVDHDHQTKAVRGLACDYCNKGLGMFLDDPERVELAAAYLRLHKGDHHD